MRSPDEVREVLRLIGEGWNNDQIARSTGISRWTIGHWRRGGVPGRNRPVRSSCPRCDGRGLDEAVYAYLLGLYLGDGSIIRFPRAYKLVIVQDARYGNIIEETRQAMAVVRHCELERIRTARNPGCTAIYTYWKHWVCVFPQHGSGAKHLRKIELEDWQRQIVRTFPDRLLRGLIQSDGCRCMNRVSGGRYTYPRYFFTNHSLDIQQLFRDACEAMDIACRNSNRWTISVARRDSVAALDRFVGPKSWCSRVRLL